MCGWLTLKSYVEGSHSWSSAPVQKTGDPQGSVGSNPTPSATAVPPPLSIAAIGIVIM